MAADINARFNQALDRLMQLEGGYADDHEDTGGETKYGISQKAYPHLDIPNLSMPDAELIYLKDYWRPLKCQEIWYPLDEALFIFGANAGVKKAGQCLQDALNGTVKRHLKVDGVIGPKTLAAVDEADPVKLFWGFLAEQLFHYRSCETWWKHYDGWVNRVARCLAWWAAS